MNLKTCLRCCGLGTAVRKQLDCKIAAMAVVRCLHIALRGLLTTLLQVQATCCIDLCTPEQQKGGKRSRMQPTCWLQVRRRLAATSLSACLKVQNERGHAGLVCSARFVHLVDNTFV